MVTPGKTSKLPWGQAPKQSPPQLPRPVPVRVCAPARRSRRRPPAVLQRLDLTSEDVILGLRDVLAGGGRRDRGHIRNPIRDQPVISMADGSHDWRVRDEDYSSGSTGALYFDLLLSPSRHCQ